MKRAFGLLLCLALLLCAAGCAKAEAETPAQAASPAVSAAPSQAGENRSAPAQPETEDFTMKLFINDTEVPVVWESCAAVEELKAEAAKGPITVSMSMYGGWEQVGSLGRRYTRNDRQITADNGDIVLYSGDKIVVFYGSNSWSYTKLGRMSLSADEVTRLLSHGDVVLTVTAG